MSLHDAYYAMSELGEGRRPDSNRALDGLHALISVVSRTRADPLLVIATDALQRFVVGGNVDAVCIDPALPDMLATLRHALQIAAILETTKRV